MHLVYGYLDLDILLSKVIQSAKTKHCIYPHIIKSILDKTNAQSVIPLFLYSTNVCISVFIFLFVYVLFIVKKEQKVKETSIRKKAKISVR